MRLLVALLALSLLAQQKPPPKTGSGKKPFGKSYYVLDVPSDYTPAKKYGLIIMLHGSGGRPESYAGVYKQAVTKGYILCLPASNKAESYDDEDEKQVPAMIDEVLKNYAIDRDRILLSGHSAGAAISFFLVAGRPDLFTACAPGAGGLRFGVEKLKDSTHVPFYLIAGKKDPNHTEAQNSIDVMKKAGFDMKFDDPDDWDHGLCQEAWNRMFTWFDGLCPPDQQGLLQAARGFYEKSAWGRSAVMVKKVISLKTATEYSKKRANLMGAGIEAAAQKELDDAKAADEAGDTKKAVAILTKAKPIFDGSDGAAKIEAALKEYKKKIEPPK